MRIASIIYLMLASLLPAFAQPDAASLIQKSASALNRYRSFQYVEEMTIDTGMLAGISMTTVVRGIPGKVRRDIKTGGVDSATMIADGDSAWIYLPAMKQYSKVDASSFDQAELAGGMNPGMLDEVAANAKVLRSEILEVDGQPHDCWVVEAKLDHLSTPGPAGGELRDAVFTYWFDKNLGLDLQMIMSGTMDGAAGGKAMRLQTKNTTHSLQFDMPLDGSLFVFTPPEGATETTSLIPGAAAPAAGKPPEKAVSLQAAPVSGEPQAYVPHLKPINMVDSVRPADAKAAGLQGMVDLLVTVDPGGLVVNVEVLTGPQELRQAAIDTAKQWRFRPVIRDGHPVYAYTDGTVHFIDPEKPRFEDQTDMADMMKASERRLALEAKFPRTPEQVLADTEQDVGDARGQDRGYELPDLAKAAVDAGALEKALSYANEMLQRAADSDPQKRDWNYGNEIYSGNMVLGLVALRHNDVAKARQYLLDSAKGIPQCVPVLLENGRLSDRCPYGEGARRRLNRVRLTCRAATATSGWKPSAQRSKRSRPTSARQRRSGGRK